METHRSERDGRGWSLDRDVDWSKLEFARIVPSVRQAMAESYGRILRAEQAGLLIAERLVDTAPEGTLRDLALEQLGDERRHVQFFARVTSGLGGEPIGSPNLDALLKIAAELQDYTALMTLIQVIEGAANALFRVQIRQTLKMLQASVRLPGTAVVETLLRDMARLVGRDEAQHVATGMRVLRARYAAIGGPDRRALAAQVQVSSALMLALCSEFASSYRRFGVTGRESLERIVDAQQRYWRHLEIDVQLSPPASDCYA